MKKLFLILLCVALLLLCCACSNHSEKDEIPNQSKSDIVGEIEGAIEKAVEESKEDQTDTREAYFNVYPRSSDSKYYVDPKPLPNVVYTTSGTENKLGGNVYIIHGVVKEFIEMEMDPNGIFMDGFSVETEQGTVVIHDMIGYLDKISTVSADFMRGDDNTDYTMPQAGEEADFICIYNGFSGRYECPYFYFGCDEELVLDVFLDWQNEDTDAAGEQMSEKETKLNKDGKEIGEEDNDKKPIDDAVSATTDAQAEALSVAYNYLNVIPFSYTGLIDQLEYEGFTTEDAIYAADFCDVDWNEQAVICAKNYLSTLAFSYSGMIDQLEYEGFTSEQATHGADSCGADWNEQAVKSAKSYLDIFDYSRSELINQLVYEGFTYDQAEHGASQNGL